MGFCFIVTTCIKNNIHENQLLRCLESIIRYHKNTQIYLINDSDNSYDIFFHDLESKYYNVKVIPSYNKGCGEQQIFKFILDCNEIGYNDNIIYIHDSVVIKREFDNIDCIDTLRFLWHFTNHRIHWDNILEDKTPYNITHHIVTHSDLVKHYIIKYYKNPDFVNYALFLMNHKDKWVGCMGYQCIIKKQCLVHINEVINFADIFIMFNTKRERVINESIFSIICHYVLCNSNFEKSYGGLYYDGIHNNPGAYKELGFDNLKLVGENKYFAKISFSR
jgi:hypothetical protein